MNKPIIHNNVWAKVWAAAMVITLMIAAVWWYRASTADSDTAWAPGWRFVSSFHTPRRALAAVTNGRFVYVIGGVDDRGAYAKTVEYAEIKSDGTLSQWRPTSALSTGRIYLAAAYLNGFIYVLGGGTGPLGSDNTPTALVERATIRSDGSLGPWHRQAYMTTPRRGLKVVVNRGRLYAIGGYNGTFLRSVERADVDPDGNITGWTQEAERSVLERYIHAAAVWRNHVYLLGGHVHNPVKMDYGDVESAVIRPDGHIAPWEIERSVLQVPRFVASAFAMGDYLYMVGGHNETRRLRSVEFAKIRHNGHVDTWHYTAPLSLERSATALAVAGDRVYVLGGMGNDRVLNEVEMARQGDDGHLGHTP
jgi:N-acetylneuraminic acid mutarotase